MTGRERLLTALHNGKPDRLPCQVHSWMDYYRNTYLNGRDQWEAYDYFGMDPVIYLDPKPVYASDAFQNWKIQREELPTDEEGVRAWRDTVTTPDGELVTEFAANRYTDWVTRLPIQTQEDFEIWNRHVPLPAYMDWGEIVEAKKRLGNRGIVRGSLFDFGQGSPWQSFVGYMRDVEQCIYDTFDEPDWVHGCLNSLLKKKLEVIDRSGKIELDLVECGGGAGSSTVISPAMHEEFCLPYDQKQISAIHGAGAMVVYHLCGGLMPLLEMVTQNGTDALETMTPPGMGGDCNLAEANRRIGDKLCFVGGFDQGLGFERGNPVLVRKMVRELFECCPNGGYIISPSDHFFEGGTENVQAFADAVKECVY